MSLPVKLELMPGVWVTMIPYQDSKIAKLEYECDETSGRKLQAEAQHRGMPLDSLIQQLLQEAMDRGVLKHGPRREPPPSRGH